MKIAKETKLTDLLDQYPWLKEEMSKINNKFKMLNTPMGKINYNAICSVFNNSIELDISTSQGNFKITGKKIK